MKIRMRTPILVMTLLSCLLYVGAIQGQDMDYKKNSSYLTASSVIFVSQFSFSQERQFYQKEKNRLNAKLTLGTYTDNNYDLAPEAKIDKNYVALSAVAVVRILEINAGLAVNQFEYAGYSFAPDDFVPNPDIELDKKYLGLKFYGNMGLRFEKNHFLFRCGIGNMEFLYLSLGANF